MHLALSNDGANQSILSRLCLFPTTSQLFEKSFRISENFAVVNANQCDVKTCAVQFLLPIFHRSIVFKMIVSINLDGELNFWKEKINDPFSTDDMLALKAST